MAMIDDAAFIADLKEARAAIDAVVYVTERDGSVHEKYADEKLTIARRCLDVAMSFIGEEGEDD